MRITSASNRFATVTMSVTWLLLRCPSLPPQTPASLSDPARSSAPSDVAARPLSVSTRDSRKNPAASSAGECSNGVSDHPPDPSAGGELRRVSHEGEASQAKVVGVTTEKRTYQTAEVVGVSIRNGLDQTVRGSSQYAYCTIVTLEQKQDDSWEPVVPCTLLRMTATVDIEPGQTAQVWLPTSEQPEPRHQAGTYRIGFQYEVLDRERSKHVSTGSVHSESFTIGRN